MRHTAGGLKSQRLNILGGSNCLSLVTISKFIGLDICLTDNTKSMNSFCYDLRIAESDKTVGVRVVYLLMSKPCHATYLVL